MTADKSKRIYTTGQVAQICNVAPRTVTKWFDSGKLRGYRIPGSRDRRIPAGELLRFMQSHNIPTNSIAVAGISVLVIDSDSARARRLADILTGNSSYSIHCANSDFEAGILTQKLTPQAVLINLSSPGIDADYICRSIHSSSEFNETRIIAICADSKQFDSEAVVKKGYDLCLTDVNNVQHLLGAIDKAIAIVC